MINSPHWQIYWVLDGFLMLQLYACVLNMLNSEKNNCRCHFSIKKNRSFWTILVNSNHYQWCKNFCIAGNEEIIHLAGDENDGINGNFDSGHLFTICGRRFNKANVKIDNFWDVVGTSKAKKNNDKDKKCKYVPI